MAREATVAGLEERLVLLTRTAPVAEVQRAAQRAADRVSLAFANCGFQIQDLAAYAHGHRIELQGWLAANPQVAARMDGLRARVNQLASQIPAPAPAAR